MAKYQNAYRETLHDDSDIQELERYRNAVNVTPEGEAPPTIEEVREAPELAEAPQTNEDAVFKKRYADLRRHQAATEKRLNDRIKALEEQLKANVTSSPALPTSEDEVEKWAADFPDVARIVQAIAARQTKAGTAELEAKLRQVEEREARTARQEAEMQLRARHADLDIIREDIAFHDWASKQAGWVKHAIYEGNDWQACADAIDLYKAKTGFGQEKKGPGRPRKEDQAAASAAVKTTSARSEPTSSDGKKRWKESEINKLHWRDYEKYESEIDAARREGRVIYDLSGAAM